MINKFYTVYDSKVQAYMSPFMAQNAGHATRMFADAVADEKSVLNKHPEDYTLFEIGSWDDQTAKFESLATPKSLGLALEFVQPKEA